MRRLLLAIAGLALIATLSPAGSAPGFATVDILVDSGDEQLVACQIELLFDGEKVEIVSLEGGEPESFREAPYYDPAGMSGGRMIIAAFTTDDIGAPKGKHRLARLHLQVAPGASPNIEARVMIAARPGGGRIPVEIEIK